MNQSKDNERIISEYIKIQIQKEMNKNKAETLVNEPTNKIIYNLK